MIKKNRANDVAALMNNWSTAEKAAKVAEESFGTAREEQDKWANSLEARLQDLSTTWELFSNHFLDSDALKVGIGGLTGVLNVVDSISSTVGSIPSIAGVIGGVMGAKGKGFFNYKDGQTFLGNASFNDLVKAYKQGSELKNDKLSGFFSGVSNASFMSRNGISKTDYASLQRYNETLGSLKKTFGETKGAQMAYNATMKNTSKNAQDIAKSYNGQAVALDGLKKQSIGARVATSALNMAANTVLSMGVTTAISAIANGIQSIAEKEKKARQEALETSHTAMESADNVVSAYQSYRSASEAYQTNAGSKEALTSATNELASALGIEESQINSLVSQYGTLDNAMQKLAKNKLEENLQDMTSGYTAAKEELVDIMDGDWWNPLNSKTPSISWTSGSMWKDFSKNEQKQLDNLVKKGFLKEGQFAKKGGEFFLKEVNSAKDAISNYNKVQDMLDEMESKVGEGGYTAEDLSEDSLYKELNKWRSDNKKAYEDVIKHRDAINKNNLSKKLLEENNGMKELPKNYQDYLDFREKLIKEAQKNDSGFIGSDKEIADSIDANLGGIKGYEKFATRYEEEMNRIKNASDLEKSANLDISKIIGGQDARSKQQSKDFESQIDGYIKKSNTLKDALKDMSENGGELSDKQLKKLKKDIPELANYTGDLRDAIQKVMNTADSDMIKSFGNQFSKLTNKDDIANLQDIEEQLLAIGNLGDTAGLTVDITSEKGEIDKVNTALKESASATGLATESIDTLKSRYNGLKDYDMASLFEKTANGVRLNSDAVEHYEQELAQSHIEQYSSKLENLNDKYELLNEQVKAAGEDTDIGKRYAKMAEATKSEIDNLKLEIAQYEGLTSAYNQYLSAKDQTDERAGYETIFAGRDSAQKLIEHGWTSDAEVTKYLDLVLGKESQGKRTGNNAEDWNRLSDAIGETGHSLNDYFQTAEDGSLIVDGLYDWVDDIGSIFGERMVKANEDGSTSLDLMGGKLKEVADTFGMSEEAVQLFARSLQDAGWDIQFDDDTLSYGEKVEKLKDNIKEGQQEVEKLGETPVKVDIDTNNVDKLNEGVETLKENKQKLEEKQGQGMLSEADSAQLDNINNQLELAAEKKVKLEKPSVLNVDSEKVDENLSDIYDTSTKLANSFQDLQKSEVLGDTKGIQKAKKEIKAATKELSNYSDEELRAAGYVGKALEASGVNKKERSKALREQTTAHEGSLFSEKTTKTPQVDTGKQLGAIKSQVEGQELKLKVKVEVEEKQLDKLDKETGKDRKTTVSVEVDGDTSKIDDVDEKVQSLDGKIATAFAKTDGDSSGAEEVENKVNEVNGLEGVAHVKVEGETVGADEAISKAKQIAESAGNKNVKVNVDADTSNVQSQIASIGNNSPHVKVSVDVDGTGQVEALKSAIASVNAKSVNVTANVSGTGEVRALASAIDSVHSKAVSVTASVSGTGEANALAAAINAIPASKTSIINTIHNEVHTKNSGKSGGGLGGFNGTAHAQGTAKARGDWGNKHPGMALTGELGQEIIVRGSHWFTVGDNGAEFVNLKKDDIVFNHLQTREILKNGSITSRGQLLYNGTAYANGNAYGLKATGVMNRVNTSAPPVAINNNGGTVNVDTGGGNNGGGGGGNATTPAEDASKKNEEFKKWVDGLFDWIEVRLDRIKTKIDNATKRAEAYAEDGKYSKSAKYYKTAIKQTNSLISNENKGSKRYMKQANSVMKEAVKRGIINEGQAKTIKSKVAKGRIDIENIQDDGVKAVVSSYKDYYEKAKNAANATFELKRNIQDYYEKLYHLPLDKASNAVEKLANKLDMLSSKADAVSGGGTVYNNIVLEDRKSLGKKTKKVVKKTQKNVTKAENKWRRASNKKDIAQMNLLDDDNLTKKQKKAVKQGKKIKTDGITNKKTLKKAKKYNKSVKKLSTTKKKYKTATKTNRQAKKVQKEFDTMVKKAQKTRKKYNKQETYVQENAILDQELEQTEKENKANLNAYEQTLKNLRPLQQKKDKADKKVKTTSKKALKVKGLSKKQKSAIKKGKKVSTKGLKGKKKKTITKYNKAIKAQKKANSVAYKAAKNANSEALLNLQNSETKLASERREKSLQKLENIENSFDAKRNLTKSAIERTLAKKKIKKSKGETVTRKNYAGILKQAKTDTTNAKKELDAYEKTYKKNKKNLTADEQKAAKQKINELKQAWYEAKKAEQDYKSESIQADIDNVQKVVDKLKAQEEILNGFAEKNTNIKQQIKQISKEYDLQIEQEVDVTKKAELRAEKEKTIRDLLKEQLDNIREQADAIVNYNNAIQGANDSLLESVKAQGRDNTSIRTNNLLKEAETSKANADELRKDALESYMKLHGTEYGSFDANGKFNVKEDMIDDYRDGMTEYYKMLDDAYKEEANMYSKQYDAWEEQFLNPIENSINKLTNDADALSDAISLKDIKGIDLTAEDYGGLIRNSVQQNNALTEENRLLKEQQSLLNKDSEKYKEIQERIDSNSKKIRENTQQQEEWNNRIGEIPFDKIQEYLDMLDSVKARLESEVKIDTTRGLSQTEAQYNQQIRNRENYIAELENRKKLTEEYLAEAETNPEGVYYGKDIDQYKKDLEDIQTELNNTTADIEDMNNSIAQIKYDNIERVLDLLKAQAKYNESLVDLKSSRSIDLDEDDYISQMEYNNKQIDELMEERRLKYLDYQTAVKEGIASGREGNGVYGGKTEKELLAEYNEFGTSINELEADNEKLKDSLRDDVYWRPFERAHEAAKQFGDVLSGLSGLISDDMYFDKDKQLTKFGVAKIGNLVSEYENARTEVSNYQDDIRNLNMLYGRGEYTEKEYTDKLRELQNEILNSANAMKSFADTIIDMYKEIGQNELDALLKLIDQRSKALQSKKSYYEYGKNLKDKTKEIELLESEIAALNGVQDAESRAKKARLEADLAEKKEDLQDTVNEHMFELSQNALDELRDILQEEFDDKWEHINSNLEELQKLMDAANQLTSSQTAMIGSTLNELLNHYGITSSSGIMSYVGYNGYASGTKSVNRNKLAWTQENGNELIVRKSDGAILTPLAKGDSVLNANMTNNLFKWGSLSPDDLLGNTSTVPTNNNGNINFTYDKLINIEGNVDEKVLPELKQIMEQTYRYTVTQITKESRQRGMKMRM